MPAPPAHPYRRGTSEVYHPDDVARDNVSHVQISQDAEDIIAELHKVLSGQPLARSQDYPETHLHFADFLHQENSELEKSGVPLARLGVCFKDLTTWGSGVTHAPVKTLKHALWRTLTCQDLYEWSIGRLISNPQPTDGRPLIRNFSGVVRSGEILLVLGRPGSGCSTFLRTVANDHSSFLGITGSLDYSGLTPQEVSRSYRGEVAYIPEDDVHFPTLTVRQTLEFALESKAPKRCRQDIPRYLDMFARVFGLTHVLNTLVGDEYIRGVSGGERKRISIIESLATNSSVVAWDNSTRGLDAASALDYARCLRIMTDTCGKATIVSLYQVSDSVYDLADKVLLIDEGRMLFQGPAQLAKQYFESLGYECQNRQTIADFLASVTSVSERRFQKGWENRAPKGSIELEKAFLASPLYQELQRNILSYEAEFCSPCTETNLPASEQHNHHTTVSKSIVSSNGDYKHSTSEDLNLDLFKQAVRAQKSRYVPTNSSYTISFPRQVYLCAKRQWWQLKGHPAPFYTKTISTVINALLIGSMFYNQPVTSDGAFSRGGFMFYSSILLGWIQLAELEDAVQGRGILNRQKKFAFVKPSAVSLAKVFLDLWVVLVQVLIYSIIAYFLAGMQRLPGPFFIFIVFIYVTTICMTAQFRLIGAISPNYEVAIRYCGVLLLLYVVFGGYLISLPNLINNVPWFGWIAYLLPVTYTYESLMATEFHGLDLICSLSSIIPRGLGYSDIKYQSCAIAGSSPGLLSLSGDSYIAKSFGFIYKHVWRDFGILILFTVAFIALAAWFSELFEWSEGGGGAIEYKGTISSNNQHRLKGKDEEEKPVDSDASIPPTRGIEVTAKCAEARINLSTSKEVFTWHDLHYAVPYEGGQKPLLNGVSGYCKPGHMTALVGSSGAGKTTLLNILAQRQRAGVLTGAMLLDGKPLGSSFQKKIGFCEQMDIHDESSTIREAFEFSALLRQPSHIPREEKMAYANTVLEMLDLVELQDAIIWSLPLEQKKRTTIGVELCAKPTTLLFLDEPTSGLDGQGAMNVLRLLKRLAEAGQAVLCTIHQATQEQFTLFDKVLALNPGGNTFYFGDIGSSGETIFDYFRPYGIDAKQGKNVAEFLIDVGVGVLKSSDNLDFNEVWRNSPELLEVQRKIDGISKSQDISHSLELSDKLVSSSDFSASTWEQAVLLTKRISKQYWRSPEYTYSRLYASFIHAFLNGFTFFQLGQSITDMQLRMFSCFLILMIVPEVISASSMRFIANRDIWESREYPSRIYGWTAFSIAQIASEIPYAVIGSIIFYVLFYFPVGLPLGLPAGYTFLMVLLFHLFTASWGQWIGAISKDAIYAANLMPFMVIMCELFNGVLRPQAQMPVVWKYTMYYIAPFTYWIGGVLSTVLSGQTVVCDERDLTYFVAPPGQTCGEYSAEWILSTTGYISNSNATSHCGYCKYSVADDFLTGLNLDPSKSWPYFGIFVGFVISNVLLVVALMKLYVWRNLSKK